MCVEKSIERGCYRADGYLDINKGEVRVVRLTDGKQVAYLGQTKDYSEWCGLMKKSTFIKKLVQETVKTLESEFKAP